MTFDLAIALKLANFANDAYSTMNNVGNPKATPLTLPGYTIVEALYANDLWDDNPDFVPYGFIAKSVAMPTELIVAIRGTQEFAEWIDDGNFVKDSCPFAPKASIEAGFANIYNSLAIAPTVSAKKAKDVILNLANTLDNDVTLRITGHSLGSALATLLAGDLAANGCKPAPQIYTFASPLVGDAMFARIFNNLNLDSWRIDNTPDWVPNLPPATMGYMHVDAVHPIDSTKVASSDPLCCHSLNTYMHMLDKSITLNAGCVFHEGAPTPFGDGPPGQRG